MSNLGSTPFCALGGTIYDLDGVIAANATVEIVSEDTQHVLGYLVRKSSVSVVTDSNGVMPTVNVPQGISISVTVRPGTPQEITVPTSASADLSTLLSNL